MNFFGRNNLLIGFLIGAVIPFVGYAIFLLLNEQLLESGNLGAGGNQAIFDRNSLLLFAICLNLIPFTIFQRRRFSKSMRGVLSATLIYALVWMFFFSSVINF